MLVGAGAGMAVKASKARHWREKRLNKQLPHLDGRTKPSTRYKALAKALADDLGHPPSVREQALIKQAAAAIVTSESIQGLVLSGTASEAELAEQSKLANVICRLLNSLTLTGKVEGQRPDLDAYLDASEKASKP